MLAHHVCAHLSLLRGPAYCQWRLNTRSASSAANCGSVYQDGGGTHASSSGTGAEGHGSGDQDEEAAGAPRACVRTRGGMRAQGSRQRARAAYVRARALRAARAKGRAAKAVPSVGVGCLWRASVVCV